MSNNETELNNIERTQNNDTNINSNNGYESNDDELNEKNNTNINSNNGYESNDNENESSDDNENESSDDNANELNEENNKIEELKNDHEDQFSDNDSDSDSELDIGYFNLSDESDVDLFDDDIIVKKETEIVPEDERIYEDIAYQKDLYDTLITEYPLYKRSERYIERKIELEIERILKTKNIGLDKIKLLNNNINYTVVDDYYKNNFSQKWIIPIVSDNKVIFSNITNNDLPDGQDNSENILISNTPLKSGYIIKDQKNQLKELKILENEESKGNINYQTYLKKKFKISLPYVEKKDNDNSGKNIILNNATNLLRYNNTNDIYWQTRMGLGNLITNVELIDNETNEILKIEDKIFVPGEHLKIVGFYVIPFGHKNINVSLSSSGDSKIVMSRFGILGNIKTISISNPVEITVDNHGLIDGQKVYITKTNSYPSINGIYQKSVKVLNKNMFSIDVDTSNGKQGNKGILMADMKLHYDLYNVNLNKNDINIKKEGDIEYPHEIPKLFLFNSIEIKDNETWKKILNKIIPTVDNIISLEYPYLKECNSFLQINNILKKYSLNFNDLDLKQVNVLKKILSLKPNKITKKYNSIEYNEKNINEEKKLLFNESEYIFSDKFITNDTIEKYYGKYNEINRKYDSVQSRINWITNQKDGGSLYFKIVIQSLYNNIDNLKDEVKKQKNIFQKEFDDTVIDFEKEEKLKNYISKENSCEKNDMTNITNDKNWEEALKNTGNNHEKGRKALVNKGGNPTIFEWNGKDWEELKELPKYKLLKYICEFKNTDIENLDFTQLSCLYRRSMGCHSRQYTNFKIKYNKLKKRLDDFILLEKFLDDDEYKKNTETSIQDLTVLFDTQKNSINIEEKSINNKNIEVINEQQTNLNKKQENINKLINKIRKIHNSDERTYLIDKIISNDSLLVGKDLYSIKYGVFMICGHHYYNMLYNRAVIVDEKENIKSEMIQIYGDAGQANKEFYTCTNCGEAIGLRRYDETEGFNSFGQITMSREIWKDDKQEVIIQELGKKTSTLEEEFSSELCKSIEFKDILIKKGLTYKILDKTMEICEILVDISAKAGVVLLKKDIFDILIDCTKILSKKPTKDEFIAMEKKRLRKTGKSEEMIKKIEEKGGFEKRYVSEIGVNKYITITARLLICLQTSIPRYSRTIKDSLCAFSGFDDEKGLNYFVCILDKILKKDVFDKNNKKKDEKIKELIEIDYNKFKNYKNISELFKRMKKYKEEEKKLIDKINNDIKKDFVYSKHNKLENKLYESLKSLKNGNEIEEKKVKILQRLNYLTQTILSDIKLVIQKSPINEIITRSTENSCCNEEVNNYINYFTYISLQNGKDKILDNIVETNELYDVLQSFINKGAFNLLYLMNNRNISIDNKIIISGRDNDTKEIIDTKFLLFVGEKGKYYGQKRDFIGNPEEPDKNLDIKTGKTREQIKEEKHNSDEYLELLNKISQLNFKEYKKFITFYEENNETLKNLLEDADIKLIEKLNKMIDYISHILKKNNDNEFKEKYKNFLKNIGNINIKNNNDLSKPNRIKKSLNKKNNKIIEIKKLITRYFITNIEKVRSQFLSKEVNIPFSNSNDIVKELQISIYNENQKLKDFEGEKYAELFKKIKLEYSYDFINNIYSEKDIWNCTYEKVKIYKKYNTDITYDILLFILLNIISSIFIQVKDINEIGEHKFSTNETLNIMARFIIKVFDIFMENEEIMDVSHEDLEKLENKKREEIKLKYMKDNLKMEGVPSELYNLMRSSSNFIDDIAENYDIEHQKSVIEKSLEEKKENIMEKGEKILKEKLGNDVTAQQIDDFTEDYLANEYTDAQIEMDAFNLVQPNEGLEVMESGYAYGQLPQNINNDGDGISDDFFTNNGIGYLPKRL